MQRRRSLGGAMLLGAGAACAQAMVAVLVVLLIVAFVPSLSLWLPTLLRAGA
jgi:hypothetical protein